MAAPGIRGALVTAAAMTLLCGLVACGGSPNHGGPATTGGAGSSAPASPNGLVVTVTIAHGQVTPTNATLQAKVGQSITLRVSSDAPDELHVHSDPDHKFQVAAAPNQTFDFSVDVPGNVEVELHHLDRTIATIRVRP